MYRWDVINEALDSMGPLFTLDKAINSKMRGSVAKAKVEIDLTKEKPAQIWIGYDEDGYWQDVEFEDLEYCHPDKVKQWEDLYMSNMEDDIRIEMNKAKAELIRHHKMIDTFGGKKLISNGNLKEKKY
ncbi:hypothetical protein HAX54_001336 [Datura stramonium]|uniref:Uncharacterized protein n=1 Tax=Datura stramonium TaxID=4076 RepID=A0ABS8RT22_DATST|nr:hypothetical protein [Datura stramonium]